METINEKDQQEVQLEMLVADILRDIGIPCNILGYRYVVEAIMLGVNDRESIDRITKRLYPLIATKFCATPSRVERAIRHAIETAWNRGNMELHDRIFGYSVNAMKGKPTNSEFIAGITEYIRLLHKTGRQWDRRTLQ